jgi:DNA-binding response OmpR family regulator
MKILIVEDEKEIAWIWKEELKSKNHTIKIAGDGEEALKMAKSFLPDIILLDLILPKKDGMIVLAELKADPNLKKIPVVVLSNLSGDENIKKALSLGAVDYFVKTQHSIYEVMEKVQKYIAK